MTIRGVVAGVRALPRLVLIGLVRFYQLVISPWTPQSCRFYPSCSRYAVVALERHGAVRGTWLAVRRLGRCHPWAAGGVDDVPPARAGHSDHSGHSHDSDGGERHLPQTTARAGHVRALRG